MKLYFLEWKQIWESDIRWLVDILLANEMRNAVRCVHFLDGFSHCLLSLPPPQSFSVLTLVQLSPGFNCYFANHKRKNAPKKLADMQAKNGNGKRWITISMLVCWRNSSFYPFIIEHFDIKLTGSSMIPPELGISCFSKWTLHLSLLSI